MKAGFRPLAVVAALLAACAAMSVSPLAQGRYVGLAADSAYTARAPEAPRSGQWGDFRYTVPEGWTTSTFADGVLHASGIQANGERCQLGVLQPRPTSGDLTSDAIQLFQEAFKVDPRANSGHPFPMAVITRGTASAGWRWVMVRKSIGGQLYDYGSLVNSFVFVALIRDQIRVMVGTSADPLVSMCFGTAVRNVWAEIFHSIHFTSWTPATQAATQRRQLVGTWGSRTLVYSFADDGKYALAGQHGEYGVSLSETGTFQIDRNTLLTTSDKGRQIRSLFRLVQESDDLGRTWTDQLCMLDQGVGGEVCFRNDARRPRS